MLEILPLGDFFVKKFLPTGSGVSLGSSQNYKMPLRILRSTRKKLRLSQEAIAADIGISVSQISRVERGERKLHLDEAARWAARLGITLGDIPFEEPPGKTPKGGESPLECIPELQLIEEVVRATVALGHRQWGEAEYPLVARLIQGFSLKSRLPPEAQEIRRMKLELAIRRAFQKENR